ncbi:hypothetical protein [Streptomyces sp. NPDC002640]
MPGSWSAAVFRPPGLFAPAPPARFRAGASVPGPSPAGAVAPVARSAALRVPGFLAAAGALSGLRFAAAPRAERDPAAPSAVPDADSRSAVLFATMAAAPHML